MEAIKPGSTFDQWADPFLLDERRRRAHTIALPPHSSVEATVQPTSSQPDVQSDSSVAATVQEQSSSSEDANIEINVRTPTPPPRSEISLRDEPYDLYVPANDVLLPLVGSWRSSKSSFDHMPQATDVGSKDEPDTCAESTYLKLLPQPMPSVSEPQSPKHDHHYSTIIDYQRTSEIVAELEEEFTSLEIDLLVKMLEKVSAKEKSGRKKKERRKSAGDSELIERPENQTMPTFSTDDSSDSCIQLADLVQDLNELEPAGILAEQNILSMLPDSDRANYNNQGIQRQHHKSTCHISESPKANDHYAQHQRSLHQEKLIEGSLFRRNAVRQRRDTHSKPKETVNHLSKECFTTCIIQSYGMLINYRNTFKKS